MLPFDQKRAIVSAADQLRGLYEQLCLNLNDPETCETIWSLIRSRTDEIGSLLDHPVTLD